MEHFFLYHASALGSIGFLLFLQYADVLMQKSYMAVSMTMCPAEPAQAAGGSHPGWGNLGNAAQRH